MKKNFTTPQIEVVVVSCDDVIVTSKFNANDFFDDEGEWKEWEEKE